MGGLLDCFEVVCDFILDLPPFNGLMAFCEHLFPEPEIVSELFCPHIVRLRLILQEIWRKLDLQHPST